MGYLGETKKGLQKPPRSGLVLQMVFNKLRIVRLETKEPD
jgi:hypothetical protein